MHAVLNDLFNQVPVHVLEEHESEEPLVAMQKSDSWMRQGTDEVLVIPDPLGPVVGKEFGHDDRQGFISGARCSERDDSGFHIRRVLREGCANRPCKGEIDGRNIRAGSTERVASEDDLTRPLLDGVGYEVQHLRPHMFVSHVEARVHSHSFQMWQQPEDLGAAFIGRVFRRFRLDVTSEPVIVHSLVLLVKEIGVVLQVQRLGEAHVKIHLNIVRRFRPPVAHNHLVLVVGHKGARAGVVLGAQVLKLGGVVCPVLEPADQPQVLQDPVPRAVIVQVCDEAPLEDMLDLLRIGLDLCVLVRHEGVHDQVVEEAADHGDPRQQEEARQDEGVVLAASDLQIGVHQEKYRDCEEPEYGGLVCGRPPLLPLLHDLLQVGLDLHHEV
mmetsp:Transcript_26073/g.62812  ORF Transcript_26073/g.62812 Transcript_26073/m.62812 type:complete len:384 (-) Transcript_26073:687-1838(-)